MGLDDTIRERVVLMAGTVSGVDCPHCPFRSRRFDVDPRSREPIECPECGATILSRDDLAALRRADKLPTSVW